MLRALRTLVLFGSVAGCLVGPARAADQVDVVLVLAADVSRSITSEKFDLQRKGYAAALADPQVQDAIAAGPHHRIAVTFMEWSGAAAQSVVVGWSVVANKADADGFAARVLEAPRAFAGRTAIGSAVAAAQDLVAHCPFEGDRRVIDVSGDGANNDGIPVTAARDAALAGNISAINGLVILSSDSPSSYLRDHENPPGGLQTYYRENVTGGTGSFVLIAKSFESFGRALVAKLVQEIS